MAALIPETYTAPGAWASYLINGDATGIDDADRAAADRFVAWVDAGAPVSCDDAGFRRWHDAFQFCPLAADCQEYVFLRRATCGRCMEPLADDGTCQTFAPDGCAINPEEG